MAFFQEPPALENSFWSDRVLRSYLQRVLPDEVLRREEAALDEMGALATGWLWELQQRDRSNEPRLVQWDPWGRRIDRIELTPLWQVAARIATEYGLVARAYDRRWGSLSRVVQMALAYLFHPSSDIYTCPLAMTDGAAATLLFHGNRALIDRALPRLTSWDPAKAWTSGQWMTERTGGSDVGRSETVAREEGGSFRLYGTKWFTSAATSEMALTLARPEGNGPGGKGLALFYVETRDESGRLNGISLHRLKEKLGTRKLPTAELGLDGTVAHLVAGRSDGVRNIAPMLNVTRVWNAVSAIGEMGRALALVRDYGRKRIVFGQRLADKPLHQQTLASLQAEFELAFHLTFATVELLGRSDVGEASDEEKILLRLLTPLTKLSTAKQAVAVTSEALEAFGGAGYIEDTGLPKMLRDAQVLTIWEGTTDVLSLDVGRCLFAQGEGGAGYEVWARWVRNLLAAVAEPSLAVPRAAAHSALDRVVHLLDGPEGRSEALARGIATTLARISGLALLLDHAQWAHDRGDRAPGAAARQIARHGIEGAIGTDEGDRALLARCGREEVGAPG